MSREADRRAEWTALLAERAEARRRWCVAAADVADRARDPLGLRSIVRRHPALAGGVVAGAIALLLRRSGRRTEPADGATAHRRERARSDDPAQTAAPPHESLLLRAAITIGLPWLRGLLADAEADAPRHAKTTAEAPPAAGDGPTSSTA